MSLDDFYAAQPPAPLGPETLGLPPAPTPPQMPAAPQARKGRNPADLAALLTAAMLGPGAGTGVLQGIQQSKQRQREQDALQQRQQQELWRQQEQVYRYQQQQYEQEAQRRQQTLQQNVAALQKSVPTLKTKADYDKTIETFAVGLQQMGLRVDGNTLRRMVPYVAPDGTKQAGEAFERWLKNPLNKKRMESSPDLAAKDIVPFDRDGDGVPENVTIGEIVKLAGMGVVEGQAVPGMSDGLKANADGILQTLMQQAQAEGKRITPELQIGLQKQAIRMAKEAGDLGPDPALQEIRQLRADQLRRDASSGANLSPRQMSAAQGLADDFTRDSKDFISRAQSLNTILAASKDPSPAGDLALIFAYMKMLDPGSTVREGEFANAQNAAGVPDQIRNIYNRAMSGERLNPRQRADFTNRARNIYSNAKRMHQGTVRTYTDRARIAGVPSEMVVRDYTEGVEDAPAVATDGEGGNTVTVEGKAFTVQVVP
jgi:hypothetical protein